MNQIPEDLKNRAINEWNERCLKMIDWAEESGLNLLDEGKDTETLVGIDLAIELLHAEQRIKALEEALRGTASFAGGRYCWCSEHAWDCDSPQCAQARAVLSAEEKKA